GFPIRSTTKQSASGKVGPGFPIRSTAKQTATGVPRFNPERPGINRSNTMSSHEHRISLPRSPYDSNLAELAQPIGLRAWLRDALGAFRQRRRQKFAAAHLASLSDHHLQDIGVDRASITHVVMGRQNMGERLCR